MKLGRFSPSVSCLQVDFALTVLMFRLKPANFKTPTSIFGRKYAPAGMPDQKKGLKSTKKESGEKRPLQASRTGKRDSKNPKVDFRGKKNPAGKLDRKTGLNKTTKR